MRRLASGPALLATVLAAGLASAATPGFTTAERRSALELARRLTETRVPREHALAFGRLYLRRAYLVDVDPAHDLVKELRKQDLRLKDGDELKYFGLALDAILRGAALNDLKTTLQRVVRITYSEDDKSFFLESFLGAAGRYQSPLPLLDLTAKLGDNGIVGGRRREFLGWVIDQVKRGENPAYVKQMYDAASSVSPSFGFQRDLLKKCYEAVQHGVPPRSLAHGLERLRKKSLTADRLEDNLDRLLTLYFDRQIPLNKALDTVAPPAKEAEE
jgi:hypothetical protein